MHKSITFFYEFCKLMNLPFISKGHEKRIEKTMGSCLDEIDSMPLSYLSNECISYC